MSGQSERFYAQGSNDWDKSFYILFVCLSFVNFNFRNNRSSRTSNERKFIVDMSHMYTEL